LIPRSYLRQNYRSRLTTKIYSRGTSFSCPTNYSMPTSSRPRRQLRPHSPIDGTATIHLLDNILIVNSVERFYFDIIFDMFFSAVRPSFFSSQVLGANDDEVGPGRRIPDSLSCCFAGVPSPQAFLAALQPRLQCHLVVVRDWQWPGSVVGSVQSTGTQGFPSDENT
jgi:hypothetical protein